MFFYIIHSCRVCESTSVIQLIIIELEHNMNYDI